MVEEFVPLFATHRAVAGPWLRPQALTSSGSVTGATPGWSDTWLVMLNRIPAGTAPSWASLSGMGAASAGGAIRPAATAMALAFLERRDMGILPYRAGPTRPADAPPVVAAPSRVQSARQFFQSAFGQRRTPDLRNALEPLMGTLRAWRQAIASMLR